MLSGFKHDHTSGVWGSKVMASLEMRLDQPCCDERTNFRFTHMVQKKKQCHK